MQAAVGVAAARGGGDVWSCIHQLLFFFEGTDLCAEGLMLTIWTKI